MHAPFAPIVLAFLLVVQAATAQSTNPMEAFARLEAGEWRLGFLSGAVQVDRWRWGPGKHSMLGQTYGSGAQGEPWRELQLFYWHPVRKEIRFLGLSPWASGVSEGTVRFKGDRADAVYDLWQGSGDHRHMGLRWTFDGPDRYRETLLEARGAAEPWIQPPLGEWDHVRSPTLTAEFPHPDHEGPRPSKHLKAFDALVGRTWVSRAERTTGMARLIRSTVTWIPYCKAVRLRTTAPSADGTPFPLIDAYVYHHNRTDTVQCLALSEWGVVYEGVVIVRPDGALQLDLVGSDGGTVAVRLELDEHGVLRERIWSVEGAERTLVLDVRHEELGPERD